MELALEEFLEEIEIEMSGYEEISDSLIQEWGNKVKAIIKEDGQKMKGLIKKGSSYYVILKDESDIFKVVDRYYAAVENEEMEDYWKHFSLF